MLYLTQVETNTPEQVMVTAFFTALTAFWSEIMAPEFWGEFQAGE